MPDSRTYANRAQYLKQAVAKRRKTIKAKLVEYKGGKCMLCGYSKCADALDLHHIDASQRNLGYHLAG